MNPAGSQPARRRIGVWMHGHVPSGRSKVIDNVDGGSGPPEADLDPPYNNAEITEGGQAQGPASTDACGTVQRNAAGGLVIDSPQDEGCPPGSLILPPRSKIRLRRNGGQRGLTRESGVSAEQRSGCQRLDSCFRRNDRGRAGTGACPYTAGMTGNGGGSGLPEADLDPPYMWLPMTREQALSVKLMG